jgi:hypothetical protein
MAAPSATASSGLMLVHSSRSGKRPWTIALRTTRNDH